jgi:hypothetical protein
VVDEEPQGTHPSGPHRCELRADFVPDAGLVVVQQDRRPGAVRRPLLVADEVRTEQGLERLRGRPGCTGWNEQEPGNHAEYTSSPHHLIVRGSASEVT